MQKAYEVIVEGTESLMLSNVQYSDPLGEAAKQKKHFTDKKGKSKTDEVHRAVRTLDWLYSGYWKNEGECIVCLLYTSPSPRDRTRSRMPSSA